jgi:hypothetical protein
MKIAMDQNKVTSVDGLQRFKLLNEHLTRVGDSLGTGSPPHITEKCRVFASCARDNFDVSRIIDDDICIMLYRNIGSTPRASLTRRTLVNHLGRPC